MRDKNVGSVVITNDDKLAGIADRDLTEPLADEHEQLASVIQAQRTSY